MFWKITAVVVALVMLVLMSKREKEDADPVWLTILEVERLADAISCWEKNLWPLWALTLVEGLMFRLDENERVLYLHKFEDWVIDLQRELHKDRPMSEKEVNFPYFEE